MNSSQGKRTADDLNPFEWDDLDALSTRTPQSKASSPEVLERLAGGAWSSCEACWDPGPDPLPPFPESTPSSIS
jgi:hypothetical protein